MAYSIECKDLGTTCPGAFTSATEGELLKHVEVHASIAHPEMELTPETVDAVKAIVRQS
jgi:predicted small metal-binding protein